jgi:hypothetical protein
MNGAGCITSGIAGGRTGFLPGIVRNLQAPVNYLSSELVSRICPAVPARQNSAAPCTIFGTLDTTIIGKS